MWRDHPFNQRNRTTERTVRLRLEVTRNWVVVDKMWKKRGVGNIGGLYLHKIGGLALLCQLCKETLKITLSPHYKTTPSPLFLASPSFLVKMSHYSHYLKIGGGGGGGGGDRTMLISCLSTSAFKATEFLSAARLDIQTPLASSNAF